MATDDLLDRAYKFGDERIEEERRFTEERIEGFKRFHESQMKSARLHAFVMFVIGWIGGAATIWQLIK